MRLRMLVGLSGPTLLLAPGDEHEFERAEAVRLIEAGFAVPVAEQDIEVTSASPAPERRSKKGKRDVVSGDGNSRGRD